MDTKTKSVLITGCSWGIGKALAIEFHTRGLRVFAASRSKESIKELSNLGIEILELNPTHAESIGAARDKVGKLTDGKLDILINNAGQWLEKPAIETELDAVKTLFDINVFAPMQMVNEFFPLLVATKGTIVNHGSMVRSLPHPFTSAYNASKAALSQYSNTLRLELEPLDVKVVELVSGRIATGLITVPTLAEASIYKPLEQILQSRAREAETQQKAEVFAKAVVRSILESNGKVEVFKGSLASIAWAITSFGPKWMINVLRRKTSGLGDVKARGEMKERVEAKGKI